MFTSLILVAAMSAAPVPKEAGPPGPPPRVLDLSADPDGKVRVQVYRSETIKVPAQGLNRPPNALPPQAVPPPIERTVRRSLSVELTDVKDLTIYTADGKEADKALLKKLATDGGVVIVSADGKKVDPKYLKLFRDDVLILVSPELTAPQTVTRSTGIALPPAAMQLRVVPAQVLPVVPPPAVPPPANPPPPEKK